MAHSSAATHLNVTRESRTFLCRFVNESAEYRIRPSALELRGYAAANGLDCNDAIRKLKCSVSRGPQALPSSDCALELSFRRQCSGAH
jgi:hypothetical protein